MESVRVFGGAHVSVRETWTSPELGGNGTLEELQGPVFLSVWRGTLQTLQPTAAQRSGVDLFVPPRTETVVYIEEKMGFLKKCKSRMGRDTAFPLH